LDFNQRVIALSTAAAVCFEIIRFCWVLTREIAEIPEVFRSLGERSSTVFVTSLIKVKILICVTGEIAIFLAVDGVIYERINTFW